MERNSHTSNQECVNYKCCMWLKGCSILSSFSFKVEMNEK